MTDPSREASPVVDVVILTWNDGELLDLAVTSALRSQGVDVNVIVVDNGSDPPASIPDDDRVRLVRNDANQGVAPARNQGVALGNAEFVCLLDSDAELAPGSLKQLMRPFKDPSIGVSVPVFDGQRPEESAGIAPTAWVKVQRGLNRRSDYEPVLHAPDATFWDVDFGIGACQVFRREVCDAVGGLDETIFYGPEDVDFCLRVSDTGARVVQVANAAVRHPPRRAFRNPVSRGGVRHARALLIYLMHQRKRSRQRRRPQRPNSRHPTTS